MRRRVMALLAGAITLASLLLVYASVGSGLAGEVREKSLRALAALFPRAAPSDRPVLVVDIDRETLSRIGPWPWPRDRLALLVTRIADKRPAVLGLDMILVDRDGPQADASLTAALKAVPTFLGAALDPDFTGSAVGSSLTIAVLGQADTSRLPEGRGLVTSAGHLNDAAAGSALVSFFSEEASGDAIGAVPLVAAVQGRLIASMPLALAKYRSQAAAVIIDGDMSEVRIGARAVPLNPDLSMRLHHSRREDRVARTVSALSLFDGQVGVPMNGKIVLLGTSAPEIGGLRSTEVDPLMPSVQILADATEQLLQGQAPRRNSWSSPLETFAGACLALAGSLAVLLAPPLLATALVVGLSLLWGAWVVGAFVLKGFLLDPVSPVVIGLLPVQATAIMLFSITLSERRAIERRFAQHLPPEVVARIAEDPQRLKIDGEEREITALFTDIEGFTAMTERASPKDLIALLDIYVETVAGIVTAHGGMVDKIVGDAVHAFFNAPLDCDDHPAKALACAEAIIAKTAALQTGALGSKLGLGRTRIGIETGKAVLGDVGGGRKLDYTAHGPAVNAAAKLEAANKQFGTTILIGAGAAARLPPEQLVAVGSWQASANSRPSTIYTVRLDN